MCMLMIIFLGTVFLLLTTNGMVSTGNSKNISYTNDETEIEILNQATNPSKYDKSTRPNTNETTKIFVHLHVYSIGPIDVQNSRYTAQILFRYRWNDPRLKFKSLNSSHKGHAIENVWTPHLTIDNEQESVVMGSPQKDIIHYVQPDGTMVYLARMKVVLRCLMNLKKFPFDSQNCPLIIESWRYDTDELKLSWEKENPVTIDEHLQLPEYSLVGVNLNSTNTQYGQMSHNNINNQILFFSKEGKVFSTLTVSFALKRQYGYYILDLFLPSILIVIVSWFTFWLHPNSTPARTTLGTATMLTLITLSKNTGNALPKVSYIKSSEIWFLVCTAFIFTSLAEFAFSNIIFRRRKNVGMKKVSGKYILKSAVMPTKKKTDKLSILMNSDPNRSNDLPLNSINEGGSMTSKTGILSGEVFSTDVNPNINVQEQTETSLFTMTPEEIALWIDKKSRVVFPLAFLVFNTVYWVWIFVPF